MIHIGKPYYETDSQYAYLKADVVVTEGFWNRWLNKVKELDCNTGCSDLSLYKPIDDCFTLYFSTEQKNGCYFTRETSDAFLMSVLYIAIAMQEDIIIDGNISRSLYDNIYNKLLSCIVPEKCPINIKANIVEDMEENEGAVGTGVSAGVDSFYSIIRHLTKRGTNNALTHLCLFNVGAFTHNFALYRNRTLLEIDEYARGLFFDKCIIGKEIAEEFGLGFISVDSNMNDLYQGVFVFNHTYRNIAAVLSMEKLWKQYYYASSGEKMNTYVDIMDNSDRYDVLMMQTASMQKLTFTLSGGAHDRMEKTKYIASNPIVQKYLNVCVLGGKTNCGWCPKCTRTLLALDVLGQIENYQNVFPNVDFYKENKAFCYSWTFKNKKNDEYAQQILRYCRENRIKIPFKSRLYALKIYDYLKGKKQ